METSKVFAVEKNTCLVASHHGALPFQNQALAAANIK